MILWRASDYLHGVTLHVGSIDPNEHGHAEAGEILDYFADDDVDHEHVVAAYYWDDIRRKYRKYNP